MMRRIEGKTRKEAKLITAAIVISSIPGIVSPVMEPGMLGISIFIMPSLLAYITPGTRIIGRILYRLMGGLLFIVIGKRNNREKEII